MFSLFSSRRYVVYPLLSRHALIGNLALFHIPARHRQTVPPTGLLQPQHNDLARQVVGEDVAHSYALATWPTWVSPLSEELMMVS